MAKIMIVDAKRNWRNFMEILFSAHPSVRVYFDPNAVVAYDLTPDHMKFYDVEVRFSFFYEYRVEEESDPVVFRVSKRDFYNAIRELKDDTLELWYDKKAGVLKLGPAGRPEEGRVVGEVETFEYTEMGIRKKAVMRRSKMLPKPRLNFVNEALVTALLDYIYLKRYVERMLITFEWKDGELSIRVGREYGEVIVEVPRDRIHINRYEADTWATYNLELIDLPTVDNPPVKVEMTAKPQEPAKFTVEGKHYKFILYVTPHLDTIVPRLPDFKRYAKFPHEDVESLAYFIRLVDKKNLRSNNVLKPKGFAFEFLGFDQSHVLFVHAFLEMIENNITENLIMELYKPDLMIKACEIQPEIVLGVEENGTVRLCGVYFGVVATPEYGRLIDDLERIYRNLEETFKQHARNYARVSVWGDKFAKAIEKADVIRMAVWPDKTTIIEINGVRWSKEDLLEVSPAPTFTGTSIRVEFTPVLPAVATLRKKAIEIRFFGLKPIIFSYEITPSVAITGYVGAYIGDFEEWASKMGFLKPLTEDNVLKVIREKPGLNHIELSEELVSRGISARDLASTIIKLRDRGLIVKKDDKYYPAERAPPPEGKIPPELLEGLERYRSELAKFREDVEAYAGKIKVVSDRIDELLSKLREVKARVEGLKVYDEVVLREAKSAVEDVQRAVKELEGKVSELRREFETLRHRSGLLTTLRLEPRELRIYNLEQEQEKLIKEHHDIHRILALNTPPDINVVEREIMATLTRIAKAERELPRPPAPRFKVGDRVRWVKKPPYVAEEVFTVKEEPKFVEGRWMYLINGRTVPEDELEPAPSPVEAEREKVLKDVERLKEEISKARPEAEKLFKDVDEIIEHLLPFAKTAKDYLEKLDRIGRLADTEFDKRIGEVEKLVADVEGFLKRFNEDRALVRLDERLSNMKKKLEELKAKVEEFGRRAEELRGRLAKLGLSTSIAEAKPLDLATLGELVVEKIPYWLDMIGKDIDLVDVTLRRNLELTKRRLEERRKPRPVVPRELEEILSKIKAEVDRFTKEYTSYFSDVEAFNLTFDKHMRALGEIPGKLKGLKYYDERVFKEIREVIENARKWYDEALSEAVKLRDRQSELLRESQRINRMLMDEFAQKARAHGMKAGDVPGFSDIVRRLHDLVMSIRNTPPKDPVNLKDEIRRVEEIVERAERELPRPQAPPPPKPPEVKPPVEVRPPPVRPPTLPPEVKAPPPAPPVLPRTAEEARPLQRAIEDFLASRVKPPRPEVTKPIVRVDWHDAAYGWLGARISYHREVEGQLLKAFEEAGCKVERVVEARPPLKVAYVDCRGARVTAVAPPPAPPKPAPPPFDPEARWRELVERAWRLVEEWVTLYVPKPKQDAVRGSFRRAVEEAEGPALDDARAAVQAGKPELAARALEEALEDVLRGTARVVVSVAPKAREHPEIVRLLGPPAPPARPAVPAPAEITPEQLIFGVKPPGVGPEVWKWAKWLARLERFAFTREPVGMVAPRVPGARNPYIEMFPPLSSVEGDIVKLHPATVAGLVRIGERAGVRVTAKTDWRVEELLRLIDSVYGRVGASEREWLDELRGQLRGG
jgi:predicted  nucleic acid-binding Zn-ribbon protein